MTNLGSEKQPAIVRVQTLEKADKIMSLCNENGWKVIVGIEPDKPENVSDVERLFTSQATMAGKPQVGRNESCPCGSGKKYKKCCLRNNERGE